MMLFTIFATYLLFSIVALTGDFLALQSLHGCLIFN